MAKYTVQPMQVCIIKMAFTSQMRLIASETCQSIGEKGFLLQP